MNIDFARCEFGQEERDAVNRVLSGHWLASGKENELFEKEFAKKMGVKHGIAVNSGSSALLISLKSLGLPAGAKVLTSACGFPATLAPILHLGYEPVLVDYDINTHNIDIDQIAEKDFDCIILAHTMGSPVDMERIMEIAGKRPVIEDCCEAVGSKLNGKYLGSFGTMACYSFYPSHQMTALGTGGMIVTNDKKKSLKCRSLRDWGKVWDWDNSLGDHKTKFNHDGYFKQYSYETIGFNMKMSEASAAFGREQLKRLDGFRERRIENYEYLKTKVDNSFFCDISVPKGSEPSWFGFILTVNNDRISRNELSQHLESQGIRTRPFFAGNILKHKPFNKLSGDFPVADKLMQDGLFIGIWQGITKKELDYIAKVINKYVENVIINE